MYRLLNVAALAMAAAIGAGSAYGQAQMIDPPKNPIMEEIRRDALKSPNETVGCNLSLDHFYTTRMRCYALSEEYQFVTANVHRVPGQMLLNRCAKDLSTKLRGQSEPDYLNICDTMINALR